MTSSNAETEWLTLDEVGATLRVKPSTVRKWAREGTIPAAKFGGMYRIRRDDFDAFVVAAQVSA